MRITEVRAYTCDVPLAQPIRLGALRYDSRDYLVVRIETDAGITGVGYGMARYAPVARVVERNLAPLITGQDALLTEHLWERMYYPNLPLGQQGILLRALSVVDIALWDLKAKAAGLPLYRLLGGYRQQVPVQVAGGYYSPQKSVDGLADEIRGYVDAGFSMVKIVVGNVPLEEDTTRIAAARRVLSTGTANTARRLMVDAHWSWRTLAPALEATRRWADFQLTWVEDPFPPASADLATQLRTQTGQPLAIGEDVAGRWAFRDLCQRGTVDYARLDATTIGGITEFMRVAAVVSAWDVPVSPHIFPDIHLHCLAAIPNGFALEWTDPAAEIDVFHKLQRRQPVIEGGIATVSEEPGLGLEIDWDAVERYAL